MPEDKPIIVQSDSSLLLDVHSPEAERARDAILPFAALERSPEHFHTFRLNPISLWNASQAGLGSGRVIEILREWSKYAIPENIIHLIRDTMARFGKLVLEPGEGEELLLSCTDRNLRAEIGSNKKLAAFLRSSSAGFSLKLQDRGSVKWELIKIGWPVQDLAPLREGERLDFRLRGETLSGKPFTVREYQRDAARAFCGDGKPGSGFGAVVLPCGSGKTIVGMAVMERLQTNVLILTTNTAAVHQWMAELLDKTFLSEGQVGEYTGEKKVIRPVTIATYQVLTWRPDKDAGFPHFSLFRERAWGLIVYDEVHLLPAPVFRVTAELQAVRRLGLTATLVREDGKENEVFSLVGPKRCDVPWKVLEARGWIAEAYCFEIRIPLPEEAKIPYATADKRRKHRIAAENSDKIAVVEQLLANHTEDSCLVIGDYLDQLGKIAERVEAPLITGKTPNAERESIYARFRSGEFKVIVVSKVANFAIDLPDASVAIQVSGTFGSRQEEAQRLGRILRPKAKNAYFYSIISQYTQEELFAANRQIFLAEQGYKYVIELWDERPS